MGGAQNTLTVRALIMADLLLGCKIHVDSASFKGFALINTVRFSGDSFSDMWEAEMECQLS